MYLRAYRQSGIFNLVCVLLQIHVPAKNIK